MQLLSVQACAAAGSPPDCASAATTSKCPCCMCAQVARASTCIYLQTAKQPYESLVALCFKAGRCGRLLAEGTTVRNRQLHHCECRVCAGGETLPCSIRPQPLPCSARLRRQSRQPAVAIADCRVPITEGNRQTHEIAPMAASAAARSSPAMIFTELISEYHLAKGFCNLQAAPVYNSVYNHLCTVVWPCCPAMFGVLAQA